MSEPTAGIQSPINTNFCDFSTWLEETGNRGHGRSEKTIRAYISDLRLFVAWFKDHTGQPFAPELITSQDLRAYFTFSTQQERVAATTWNRRRISLAAFCDYAHTTGLTVYNPFQGVPVKEKQKAAPLSLNKSDYSKQMRLVEQAVNTAKTDKQRRLAIRNRAMIGLMIYAGLRVGELCALRRSDLLLTERKGLVKIVDGKRHKEAFVPLGREARIAIAEWLKICQDDRIFSVTERQAQRMVKEFGKAAGLNNLHPHVLRHTFVYNVLQQSGGNLALAKELARHSRIDQTAWYAMPHQEDLMRVVENL